MLLNNSAMATYSGPTQGTIGKEAREEYGVSTMHGDYAKIAEGMGAVGLRVTKAAELGAALRQAQKLNAEADLDGFYNFANNPKVNHDNLLAAHCRRTGELMAQCPGVVLIVVIAVIVAAVATVLVTAALLTPIFFGAAVWAAMIAVARSADVPVLVDPARGVDYERYRGATLLNGPIDRPWGIRTAAFRDPAGHVWELAS